MDNFSNIIGFDKEISLIREDIKNDCVSHAYLFSGPSNIGKALLIKAFSKELICGCRKNSNCKICFDIENDVSADFISFKNTEESSIKVDDVREMLKKISLSTNSRAKVVFIEDFERMTNASSNALLKMLEEAPSKTHFFLSSSDQSQLLETVISRTRHFKMKSPSKKISVEFLKNTFPDKTIDEILFAFDFSLERIGKAFDFLSNEGNYNDHLFYLERVSSLYKSGNVAESFLFIEKILSDKDNAKDNIKKLRIALSYFFRQKLNSVLDEEKIFAVKILSKIPRDAILLRRNINARLLLENLFLLIT